MCKKIISCIAAVCTVGCMLIIFKFSAQNGFDTNSLSLKFTSNLAEKIFSEFNILDDSIKNIIIGQLNLFIRKLAHFSLYYFLGFVSFLLIYMLTAKYIKAFFSSICVCLVYAVLDELHQMYVPGRTPLFRDVIIDTIGGISGIVFCFFIMSAIINIKSRLRNNNSVQSLSS